MSAPEPYVTVVVVNYNGGAFLPRCLRAMLAQEGPSFEVVVVDNGSTDGSIEALPEDVTSDPRLRVMAMGENLGFAAGNNRGAEESTARWICTLNPDAFPRPGWLTSLAAGAEVAGALMAGGTQVFADEPDTLDGLGDALHISGLAWRMGFGHALAGTVPSVPYPVFGPCAAGAIYDREMFHAVGGFDESFFCYHEDVDLALRMRRAGAMAVQIPDAVIDHVSSGITGRASPFAVYHGTRNRMWTFAGSMPLAGLILLAPVHLAMTLFMLGWAGWRSRRWLSTWRGVRDGVRGLPRVLRERRGKPDAVGLAGILPALAVNPLTVAERGLVGNPAGLKAPVRKN